VIPGPTDNAESNETTLSAAPAATLQDKDVSDTNVVAMHRVDPNLRTSLRSTVPNSRPKTETLKDPVAGAFWLIALTDEITATS